MLGPLLMTGQRHTSVSLSVFSARLFYEESRKKVVDSTSGRRFEVLDLPNPGELRIASSPQNGASLVWIDGVAQQAQSTNAFLAALQRGEIPSPLRHTSDISALFRVERTNVEKIRASSESLLCALNLTKPFCDRILKAKFRRCGNCRARLTLYRSPSELIAELLSAFDQQRIDISLYGQPAVLREWADRNGFNAQTETQGTTYVVLDSLKVSSESLNRLTGPLRSAWALPEMRIRCSNGSETAGFAPGGYCSQCDIVTPLPRRAIITQILQRGTSLLSQEPTPELDIEIGAFRIRDILSEPIDRIAQGSDLLDSQMLEDLKALGLETLTLGRTANTLSSSALARVALVASANTKGNDADISLFDLPEELIPVENRNASQDIRTRIARNRSLVVIRSIDASVLYEGRQDTLSENIGTLHIATHSKPQGFAVSIRNQALNVIVPSGLLCLEPLGPIIFEALRDPNHRSTSGSYFDTQSIYTPTYIDALPSQTRNTGTLVGDLGIYAPIGKLYASSLASRMKGLTQRDFALSSRGKAPYLCPGCCGLGVRLLDATDHGRPLAEPCEVCLGTRFRSPVREIEFRGQPLWRLLNSTFDESAALLKTLPQLSASLALINTLSLSYLPLGMPTALLSTSELRLIRIIRAILEGTRPRPPFIILEEPLTGLSLEQQRALMSLMNDPGRSHGATWIAVTQNPGDAGITALANLSTPESE